jgi:thymidylate kinase
MLIIVEGPDCAGKTTLVHKVVEILDRRRERVVTRHCGPLKTHPLVEYEQLLNDYSPGQGVHVVYDRLHLGELIYGPLKRGTSQVTREMHLHIELSLAVQGALLVVVDCDDETLMNRHEDRGDDFISPAELLVVADQYRRLQRRHTPVTQFNALHAEAAALPALIVGLADALEDYACVTTRHRTLIGPPPGELTKPYILLLGDRRGPVQNETEHARCFVPYPATSGSYLMRALDPIAWHGYTCIANAWEEDVAQLWNDLECPHVVALGSEAAKVATDQQVPHGRVPHPQWVRRFKHRDHEEYVYAILKAAETAQEVNPWRS